MQVRTNGLAFVFLFGLSTNPYALPSPSEFRYSACLRLFRPNCIWTFFCPVRESSGSRFFFFLYRAIGLPVPLRDSGVPWYRDSVFSSYGPVLADVPASLLTPENCIFFHFSYIFVSQNLHISKFFCIFTLDFKPTHINTPMPVVRNPPIWLTPRLTPTKPLKRPC